mmetsp:Transcript_53978/g.110157  ORF Transcript_53978/g.110157 Transcript_53978/m.110157 type:complete len:287 (+) Transcript_53978:1575-2435(+)
MSSGLSSRGAAAKELLLWLLLHDHALLPLRRGNRPPPRPVPHLRHCLLDFLEPVRQVGHPAQAPKLPRPHHLEAFDACHGLPHQGRVLDHCDGDHAGHLPYPPRRLGRPLLPHHPSAQTDVQCLQPRPRFHHQLHHRYGQGNYLHSAHDPLHHVHQLLHPLPLHPSGHRPLERTRESFHPRPRHENDHRCQHCVLAGAVAGTLGGQRRQEHRHLPRSLPRPTPVRHEHREDPVVVHFGAAKRFERKPSEQIRVCPPHHQDDGRHARRRRAVQLGAALQQRSAAEAV